MVKIKEHHPIPSRIVQGRRSFGMDILERGKENKRLENGFLTLIKYWF
jgi:hypothetical protein